MRNHMAAGWFYSPSQIKRYFATRVSSLKPPKDAKLVNPWTIIRGVNRHQWLMFSVGYLGWVWDAFDFFTVIICLTEIAADFGVANSEVSWGITVTLMLRSVGALIFGILSDRYGRKWPMIINLGFFVVLELGSAFCTSLTPFLAVRALYGIAMGGLFGPAAATALEDLPYDVRGVLAGLFQMGYDLGFLLAVIFYRALVPTTKHGWRSLFWFGSVPPIFIIIFRLCLPETHHFQAMKAEREARLKLKNSEAVEQKKTSSLRAFLNDAGKALRQNWVMFIYLVVLMTAFNSCAHGSQDFYPTFLKDQVGLAPTEITVITVLGPIAAILSGPTIGYLSTIFGRRLSMMVCCIFGGAIIPAYILPRNPNHLTAGVFFEQFFVGGVWAPVPIHLSELSPPALRGLLVGLTYQLGNLASAASATIQATIGETKYRLPDAPNGAKRFDYGKVMGIFLGATFAFLFFILFLGPEMSQEERETEDAAAKELDRLQREGKSLAEIGQDRAKLEHKMMQSEMEEEHKLPEGKAEVQTLEAK
ncbi:hypothetical protein LOZ58_003099 [Ophidiomyces ophidiicola]|nr:hypothetical protein LOZ65_005311 [Ophidiomyces ophidiicola]KAI1939053.1 hypothetical protein LOZ66_003131 [Ophidiomyces ophidiicola]KAI1962020.1 hypothetical protein LOZ58_003099 [Ophidiomyces ophidiicola]